MIIKLNISELQTRITHSHLTHFSAPDVRCELMKQNDVPPNWKDTAAAPLFPNAFAIPGNSTENKIFYKNMFRVSGE